MQIQSLTLYFLPKTLRKFSLKFPTLSNSNNFMRRSSISTVLKTRIIMRIFSMRYTSQHWNWRQPQNDSFLSSPMKIMTRFNVLNGDGWILNFTKIIKILKYQKKRNNKNLSKKSISSNLILKKKSLTLLLLFIIFKNMLKHWVRRLSSRYLIKNILDIL
jgi:hypothetical protein